MNSGFLAFDNIKFDYPAVLFALLIFIPLVLNDVLTASRKSKYKLPSNLKKRLTLSVILDRVFIAFSIIALAGPRWGTGFSVSEPRRGLDVVFAIDISRSMDIRDVQTGGTLSRLGQGLLIAGETVLSVQGGRYAVAIGRSRGYPAVPLTFDNDALLGFFEVLDGSSMTGRSTNLESLVDAAADVFQSTSAARKVIVLISDGESHSGVLRNALNRCVREGIIVTAVAVGSDEGSPVVQEDGSSAAVSRRDSAVMRNAAERTGGLYIDGNREDAASVLSAHLLSAAQETAASASAAGRQESKQRRSLFIILALIAYGAGKFIPRLSKLPLVSLLAVVLFLSSCSDGRLQLIEANYLFSRSRYEKAIDSYQNALKNKEAAPYAEYGLAITLYSLDEGETALERYSNSKKLLEAFPANEHRELRYRNYYNSGIIHFEEGNFQLAADAFKEALRTDPGKTDAKRNLEISLMSIEMEASRERRTEERSETRETLLDSIRQYEQQRWISGEWMQEEPHSGPDW